MMSKKWIDENGLEIPPSRVTSTEKLRERKATSLLKKAQKLETLLGDFKKLIVEDTDQVFHAVMSDEDIINNDNYKGNFTWLNFDRTIKIEKSVQGRIDFDATLMMASKAKFDEFIKNSTGGVDDMIREIITEGFSTSKGKFDVKKVFGILQRRSRIPKSKYPLYHEAAELIERAILRPDSKTYYRIMVKNNAGEYQAINLNFSSL